MLKPIFALPVLLFLAVSHQPPAGTPAPVPIPADAAKLVNPVKPTDESLARAKKMYSYDCIMCHGATGNGKGDLVADMKLNIKDFTDPSALKGVSDGELFYIIKNGKGQMPLEGDRAKPEELWNLVILVRSFSKP